MTAQAQAMKAQLLSNLAPYLEAEKKHQDEEKISRAKRWEKILERQQAALLQQEQTVKLEEKELLNLQREEQFQHSQTVKQDHKVEDSACAGVKATVRALIATSQDHRHVSCLKGQIGSCITTEVM